ncbi:unnamed protein product [Didymodactylos carnosus]|uniref:Uncharacterized protein n=1 Tax=Didymodactylos carnosus TaxID=1234261 RepID=A0A814YJS3_9BILA|nr:unnamed protein product [Didymodactylos carnosus]CAF3992359.1 unnamed protein product [Didymodactylos carnosus]
MPTPTAKVSVTIQDTALQQDQIPINHDNPFLSPIVSNAAPSQHASSDASVAICNQDKVEAQMMEEGKKDQDNNVDENHDSPADMPGGADDPHDGIVNETNINPTTLDSNQCGSGLVTSTPRSQLGVSTSILDHPFVGDAYQLYKGNQATMKRYLNSSASDEPNMPSSESSYHRWICNSAVVTRKSFIERFKDIWSVFLRTVDFECQGWWLDFKTSLTLLLHDETHEMVKESRGELFSLQKSYRRLAPSHHRMILS